MDRAADILIIGGGVIGSAIAYSLRKLGREVLVVERETPGAEASSAAAGLLAPLGSITAPGAFADLLLASWKLFPALVPELETISGISLQFEQPGSLRVVRDRKHVPNLRKRMNAWQPLGLDMEWLEGDEARQREPLLAPEASAAIYAPQEGQVLAAHVASAFARAATKAGAAFAAQTEVTGLRASRGRVTAVETARGEVIECKQLVIAAGAWSALCGQWLGLSLPVSPQRGQILALRQPTTPLRHIIFGEAIYLAPKQDGSVVVGATKEDAGFSKHTTAGGINWLLSTALRLVPALESSRIERIWVGLRPKTPDQHPILGKAPGWENVTLAIGHGSVGIALSPITGQTIAELLTSGQTPELIRPFDLERFMAP